MVLVYGFLMEGWSNFRTQPVEVFDADNIVRFRLTAWIDVASDGDDDERRCLSREFNVGAIDSHQPFTTVIRRRWSVPLEGTQPIGTGSRESDCCVCFRPCPSSRRRPAR